MLVTVYWSAFRYTGLVRPLQAASAPSDLALSSANPGALVVHVNTFVVFWREMFRTGGFATSAGGVTLAHVVPTLISSKIAVAGCSVALAKPRSKSTKLAI